MRKNTLLGIILMLLLANATVSALNTVGAQNRSQSKQDSSPLAGAPASTSSEAEPLAYPPYPWEYDWPLHGNDAACTSYSLSTAPDENATAWVADLPGGTVWAYPIVAEEKVFLGAGGNLTAWDEDTGSFLWTYRAAAQPGYPREAAYASGRVYFGTAEPGPNGCVYALNATTGQEIWNFAADGTITLPVVVGDKLFFGAELGSSGKVYCINAVSGAFIWSYATQDRVTSVAVANGKLYAGCGHWETSATAAVYCLDMNNGDFIWSYDTGRDFGCSLAVANGKVYFSASYEGWDCVVYALNAADGNVIWSTTRYSYASAGRTAVAYGKVFVTFGYGQRGVYALNETNGDEVWAFPGLLGPYQDPIGGPVVADGKVFFGFDDSTSNVDQIFYALDQAAGTILWQYKLPGAIHSRTSAIAYGRVFVADHYNQKLYAFGKQRYSANIEAHCNTEQGATSVAINLDGAATGKRTPTTFKRLTGTHTFQVPDVDNSGHPFKNWNTGAQNTAITISSGGTYVAYYEQPKHTRADTLRMKITRSPAAQLLEMTIGPPAGSDVWTGMSNPASVQTMSAQGKTVTSRGGFHYCRILFNCRVHPLDDVNFRHALAHLVPKDRIIGSLFRYLAVKLDTPVPPAQSLWYNEQVDPHAYSPEEAEAILGNANSLYAKVGGVWQYKTGGALEPLRFYIPLEVTSPTSYTIGRMIVEEAQEIGLMNINLTPMDFATYLDLVYNQWDYEIAWVCHELGRFPTHLFNQFSSEENYPGSSNPHGIVYPELDYRLSILLRSLDNDAQIVAVQDAQGLLMGGTAYDPLPLYVPPADPRSQAIPIVPIYSRNMYDAQQSSLSGTVNMFGYGIHNMWTRLNVGWTTQWGFRPGTTEKTVVMIEEEFPERLNPLFAGTVYAEDFLDPVYDQLIAINPYTLRDEPWLGTSWSYVATASGMDITFNIRLIDQQGQPVEWQDGKPISVSDVKFSWDFLYDNMIPKFWSAFRFYDGCTIVDADTIVAHMSTISQWLVYDLARTAYMLPPQVWSQAARNWPIDATRLATILGWDPSATAYPDPDGAGPLRAVPTSLFGTGPFINMHSTTTIDTQAYGDLQVNSNYWLTTSEIEAKISEMFHSAGDVNYDGKIDTADKSAMGLAFYTVPGDDLWNPNADICGPIGPPPDNRVNIFDMATLGKFFGETATVP